MREQVREEGKQQQQKQEVVAFPIRKVRFEATNQQTTKQDNATHRQEGQEEDQGVDQQAGHTSVAAR